jgi:NAD(P)-dependent dehydrogenase (short-subunit alcohol dehydrogenase family)
MDLTGRTALITGAGRGIGAATAAALARRGASVAVTARRQEDADAIAASITAAGGQALPLVCDVADWAAVQAAVGAVAEAWGGPDILISNAGTIGPIARLAEAPAGEWLHTIEVNLIGAFHGARAVLPGMVARGFGIVIHLSSGAAHKPLEGWSAYCASKAGLAMLTRSLHEEYGGLGIRSIGFSPGLVDTDMQAAIRASGVNPVSQVKKEALASVDEPAQAIAFLCGPGGAVYAGQEVDIRDKSFRETSGLKAL